MEQDGVGGSEVDAHPAEHETPYECLDELGPGGDHVVGVADGEDGGGQDYGCGDQDKAGAGGDESGEAGDEIMAKDQLFHPGGVEEQPEGHDDHGDVAVGFVGQIGYGGAGADVDQDDQGQAEEDADSGNRSDDPAFAGEGPMVCRAGQVALGAVKLAGCPEEREQ